MSQAGRRLRAPRRQDSQTVLSSNLPNDLGVDDAGVRLLLRSLAGAPTPDELAGEHAAIAMFRAAHRPLERAGAGDAADGHASRADRMARRVRSAQVRKNQVRRVVWLTAATTVALSGGFTAAGYAAVLPPPVQHIAHTILGFAGVPDSGRPSQSASSLEHAESQAPRHGPSRSGSPGHGQPAAPTASPAPALRVSVRFKTAGHRVTAVLTVTWPVAQRGDQVELQSQMASRWKVLVSHRIGRAGPTKFTVLVGTASVNYRIVLLSGNQVRSVSQEVRVPGHPGQHHRR